MGEFERRELRDFEAEEEEAEETFQLQVQDSLAQAQRERDEAMTLANSLRVCLDAAEAERTSLHARLAAAEAEVAELRPYKAALEALEVWCADPGYEISGHDAGWGAWQPDSREAGRITLVTQQSSPLALGAAVAAREAMAAVKDGWFTIMLDDKGSTMSMPIKDGQVDLSAASTPTKIEYQDRITGEWKEMLEHPEPMVPRRVALLVAETGRMYAAHGWPFESPEEAVQHHEKFVREEREQGKSCGSQ